MLKKGLSDLFGKVYISDGNIKHTTKSNNILNQGLVYLETSKFWVKFDGRCLKTDCADINCKEK